MPRDIHKKALHEMSIHGAVEAIKILTHVGANVALTASDIVATGGLIFPTQWVSGKVIDKIRGIETLKVVDPNTGTVIKMTGKFERTPEGLIIPKKLEKKPKVIKTGEAYLKELKKKEAVRQRELLEELKRVEMRERSARESARRKVENELKALRQRMLRTQLKSHAEKHYKRRTKRIK